MKKIMNTFKQNKKAVFGAIAVLISLVLVIVGFMTWSSRHLVTNMDKDRDSKFLDKQLELIEENLEEEGYDMGLCGRYSESGFDFIIYANDSGTEVLTILAKDNQVVVINGITDSMNLKMDTMLAVTASRGVLATNSEINEIEDELTSGNWNGDTENTIFTQNEYEGAIIINSDAYMQLMAQFM